MKNDDGQPLSIQFFSSLAMFQEKFCKHLFDAQEIAGWKQAFPEILKKYSDESQISFDESVNIYEETSLIFQKALQFIWEFPLHLHLERKEGQDDWVNRVLGIAPEGFLIVCDVCNEELQMLISFYFLKGTSQYTGVFQRFFAGITNLIIRSLRPSFKQPKEVRQRNQKFCTDETWKNPFGKSHFEAFFKEYQSIRTEGELTTKLDALLAKYQRKTIC